MASRSNEADHEGLGVGPVVDDVTVGEPHRNVALADRFPVAAAVGRETVSAAVKLFAVDLEDESLTDE